MGEIKLRNSMTRKIEVFAPIDPTNLRLYVCGPTVYDRAHLGNARPAIVFDVLYRLLCHVYGKDHVTYVRNFTDVDDKINAKARETGRAIGEITEETIGWYHADMDAIGVSRPTHEPRATEYIPQMIAMIEDLIAKGHAYAAEGHVLFSVASYPDYGRLSGRTVEDMIAGARVEVAPYKRDAMDFVLWKPSDADTPGWDSPWGYGRPGWHIECSAMSHELLGPHFDIHGGGNDLMFPHHENEIAQSCCAHQGAGFANIWMHNEMLQVEGKKMSKSLGNFFTVRDLLDQGVPGEVIRFVMLSTHYSKPMDWTAKKAAEAEKTLRKWYAQAADAPQAPVPDAMLAALFDDLNTPLAITALHQISQSGDAASLRAGLSILGLASVGVPDWAASPDVDLSALEAQLFAVRQTAMETKDFAPVDALKSALSDAGVEVRMSKEGVELIPTAKFDPLKLEGLL
ncbi:MAG: cysteine--tRNA ligase [Rhodobacteraceae bacterium]|jgi:cysteinyl-tRNA synthetase|uniref:cysteine--tRNA ligase n=1 Tax=Roseovarius sp. 10 TaxID=3080563 RepID=UPI001937351B|nr:cysteine--tRNA ligase [Roseovarius sp. 10]MBE1288535.1 cysteine--tRNA ligase [Paracoccaceae bacterium]MDV7199913.1 cysteine--tRNA ligase [Roseovarius sp. 10]QPI86006.1 cysteine--tRNA ligase [Rhodobacterales bacterium HKCCA1288]